MVAAARLALRERCRRSREPARPAAVDELLILPLFALTNAGVELSFARLTSALTAPVSVAVFLGLVAGKPLGVLVGLLITVRTGLGRLADDVGWGDLAGMGMTAGIGFTVALSSRSWPPAGTTARRGQDRDPGRLAGRRHRRVPHLRSSPPPGAPTLDQ